MKLQNFQIDDLIIQALKEDMPFEDQSTAAIYQEPKVAFVDLIAKEDGVIAGLPVFQRVFRLIDDKTTFYQNKKEGTVVKKDDILMTISADVQTLLSGERVALNFLQRMSGIATAAHEFTQALEGTGIRVADTRKTTPGLRVLEKYAVRVGGGMNHRYNLSDMIMLKDNHIAAAGGVKEAIELARNYAPFIHKIEVETESLEMVREAVEAKADVIMLDNMSVEMMQEAVDIIDGQAVVEASGNMTVDSVERLKGLKIDYISSGAITHSAGILDLSMKNFRYTNSKLKNQVLWA